MKKFNKYHRNIKVVITEEMALMFEKISTENPLLKFNLSDFIRESIVREFQRRGYIKEFTCTKEQ